MSFLTPITLFGLVPVILIVFSSTPPRRAVVGCFIGAWLFLPYAGYDLPGLPDYTKRSATGLGVLLATVLYRSDWLFATRLRWFDAPMLAFCLCPMASSLVNGLGPYDGLSVSFEYVVMWGLPYLIGRIYFTRPEHLRELALGMVVAGLIYVPLCAWEFRMSPRLHLQVYGFEPRPFGEIVFGGFRPKVFMSCALEVGVWMTAATTAAFWLWASGAARQIRGYPMGTLLGVLLVTAVMCKVAAAWALLILGVGVWYGVKWTGLRLPALILLLIPVLYMTTRSSGLFAGERAVNLVRMVLNERRAESFEVRVSNEDRLVVKALEQPVFGWGGWGRSRVYDPVTGKDITITDGFWVIVIGTNGVFGLASLYAALLLPMAMLIRRYPAIAWQSPTLAPACALAIICNLYAIDCIANSMMNPVYVMLLGAVTGAVGLGGSAGAASGGAGMAHLLEQYAGSGAGAGTRHARASAGGVGREDREEAAIRLGELARSLADHGMTQEAEEAWLAALQHWAALAAEHPDDDAYRRFWLDGLNDAAWSLIAPRDPEPHAVERAIALAEQAATAEPTASAYWNTLGIAYFRAGDPEAAIRALEYAAERGDGGTAFDFYFLAMAHHRLGDRDRARRRLAQADDWMARHNPEHPDLIRFRAEAFALLDSHTMAV